MGVIAEMAKSPWGQDVPVHVAFYLMYVVAILGFCFLIGHAIWFRYFAKSPEFSVSAAAGIGVPHSSEPVKRHSLAARLFHWIMAASMLTLLFTAFLPKVGVQFDWVKYHWIAGVVLTASILFHIIHATFFMDFWSIWPDKIDIEDATRRYKRATGGQAPPPRRFAKYPLGKQDVPSGDLLRRAVGDYHRFLHALPHPDSVVRPQPVPLRRHGLGGLTYLLHGLAGVGLIGLIMIHIYFALRPEKLVITKSMVFGTLDAHHYA